VTTAAYIPSALALGALFIAAGVVTIARPVVRREDARRRRFLVVSALAVLVQAAHFLEELGAGFAARLPDAFGLPPIPVNDFVVFNVMWLAIWLVAIGGVRRGLVVAVWPLWFLGMAAVLNVIAHPILALSAGAYFPGLLTSPLVGVAGILLLRELSAVTARRGVEGPSIPTARE